MRRTIWMGMLLLIVVTLSACGKSEKGQQAGNLPGNDSTAKITFIELGSVTCIPCKKMQPVMKSVEARYAGQVKVIFHDVMKDRSQSQKFGIKLIPTQVFLDAQGKELMRHEGFFAEEEIDKFLKSQGLTPTS